MKGGFVFTKGRSKAGRVSFPYEMGTFACVHLTVYVCNAVVLNDEKE